MKFIWRFRLSVFLCICLGGEWVKSQEGDSPVQRIYVSYCRDDFGCNSGCGSYVQASKKCSCHPACKLFKDCCYNSDDYIKSCSQNDDSEIFVSDILPKYEQQFQCTTDLISNERYWMVSKCPDSWSGPNECDITNKNTTITVGRLEDNLFSIPVVSPEGVTFRNIYCAICHGKDPRNVLPWSFEAHECVDTDIFEKSSNFSVKDKIHYLIDNCEEVSFLPPFPFHNSLTLIPCREVEGHVIDVCEDSVDERDIAGNCSLIAAPLTVDGNTFKNTFCFECYFEGDVEYMCHQTAEFVPPIAPLPPPMPCFIDSETGEIICPTPEPPPSLVPISITFDFGGQTGGVSISKEDDEIESISVTCGVGQVYDPLESKCVHLACPDGYLLRDIVCVIEPTIKNNDTKSCQRFAIEVTVGSISIDGNSCSSSFESVLECLPDDLTIMFTENLKYHNVSCHTGQNSSHSMFQTVTSSTDVIKGVLSSPGSADFFPSQISTFCSSINFVEIISYCRLSQPGPEFQCGSQWLDRTQWQIQENSTDEIVFKDTVEVVSLSKIKIQSYLTFPVNNNYSWFSAQVSLMRCTSDQGLNTTCPLITLKSSLFEPETNGSKILVYTQNETIRLTPDMYKMLPNGSIQVCNFLHRSGIVYYQFLPQYSHVEAVVSTVGISLSVTALSFTLLTYCVFSELRSLLANFLIMVLCACLIFAQILLMFAGVATVSKNLCAVVTGLDHFFWLAAFTTTSVLGFALSQTFALRNQATRGRKTSWKSVTVSSLICFGFPTLISGTLALLYFMDADRFDISYGSSGGCWIGGQAINFYFFGVPVAVCLLVNVAFFLHVTLSICVQIRSGERIRKSKESFKLREVLIYIKIFVILGLTWTIGFVAAATNLHFLWYAFTVLTSLQGVFIFLAFTVKSHVWRMWGSRLGLTTSDFSTQSTQSRSKTNYDKYVPKTSTSATTVV